MVSQRSPPGRSARSEGTEQRDGGNPQSSGEVHRTCTRRNKNLKQRNDADRLAQVCARNRNNPGPITFRERLQERPLGFASGQDNLDVSFQQQISEFGIAIRDPVRSRSPAHRVNADKGVIIGNTGFPQKRSGSGLFLTCNIDFGFGTVVFDPDFPAEIQTIVSLMTAVPVLLSGDPLRECQ